MEKTGQKGRMAGGRIGKPSGQKGIWKCSTENSTFLYSLQRFPEEAGNESCKLCSRVTGGGKRKKVKSGPSRRGAFHLSPLTGGHLSTRKGVEGVWNTGEKRGTNKGWLEKRRGRVLMG